MTPVFSLPLIPRRTRSVLIALGVTLVLAVSGPITDPAAATAAPDPAAGVPAVAGPHGLVRAGRTAATLKRNRLYRARALRSKGCASQSSLPLDSVANLQAYYDTVLPCLNKAWKKSVKKSGIRFRPARVVVHNGQRTSKCGALTVSFYCTSERTIYMYADEIISPWNQFPNDYSHGFTRLSATHTMAHEYGHHLQNLSGILGAIGSRYRGQTERRAELQASCLGNVFLASQADAYPIASDYLAYPEYWRYINRVPNHGDVASQQLWTEKGFSTARPGACNTFKAPGRTVR